MPEITISTSSFPQVGIFRNNFIGDEEMYGWKKATNPDIYFKLSGTVISDWVM